MAKKCPPGFVCSDSTTVWLIMVIIAAAAAGLYWYSQQQQTLVPAAPAESKIIVVAAPAPTVPAVSNQMIRPDLYPEPVQRLPLPLGLGAIASRGPLGPIQQVGILTAEGGSSNSAAPDRTILPLFGREMDSRRSRWNYYTRTDGTNPVQVPVRVRNRLCDDDTNGCDEVYNDDSVHVPALGRSFKATVYRRSMFA
jgi:hypothetical protein